MNEHSTPKECLELSSTLSSPSSSKTGTYSFRDGKLVKISDDIPSVAVDVSLGGKEDYMDEHLGNLEYGKNPDGTTNYGAPRWKPHHVTSKKDKARRMKELNLTEKGGRDVKPHGKVNYHDMTVKDRATVFVGRR